MPRPFQSIIDQLIIPSNSSPIYNTTLLIDGGTRGVIFRGASGTVGQEAMTAHHKFRIASISKLFTATLVLQLVEEGKIRLQDQVSKHLGHLDYLRWDSLSMFENISYGQEIEVVHLLKHRSGLADYIFDERFSQEIIENPTAQWSSEKIMQHYFAYQLHREPKGKPGQVYYYSDTNYLLLALLIEAVTKKSLAENYRERIFKPLNMTNSFLEFYESKRGAAPMSYPYQDTVSIQEVNTSFDWGGGGIVSTLAELNTFLRALMQGELFQEKQTLNDLLDVEPETDSRFALGASASDYGMGVRQLRYDRFQLVGHSGSWGCLLYYDPDQDLSIGMTVNQASAWDQLTAAFQEILNNLNLQLR